MYRILELRSISAIDEHNWATNKTECPISTDKYGQLYIDYQLDAPIIIYS